MARTSPLVRPTICGVVGIGWPSTLSSGSGHDGILVHAIVVWSAGRCGEGSLSVYPSLTIECYIAGHHATTRRLMFIISRQVTILKMRARHHRLAAIHDRKGKREEASNETRLAYEHLNAGLFHARQAEAIEQRKASSVHA
jgi:hypothetical protein